MKRTEQSHRSAVASVAVSASQSTQMELTNTLKNMWRNTRGGIMIKQTKLPRRWVVAGVVVLAS